MVLIGLTYTSFDSDWYQVFLGAHAAARGVSSTTSSAARRRER
jgi:hypothetical protein